MKKSLATIASAAALIFSTNSCSIAWMLPKELRHMYETCTDKQYDYDSKCLEDDLGRLMAGSYKLGKTISLKDKSSGQEFPLGGSFGSGILLENGYVLTAYHLNHPPQVEVEDLKLLEGVEIKDDLYLIARDGTKYLLKEIAGDKEIDYSLLKAPENMPKMRSFPYAMGNSDDLNNGNVLYISGNAKNIGINLREGIVSQLYGAPDAGVMGFGLSNGANHGDSGCPVLALRDGKLELVGIVTNVMPNVNDIAYAPSINSIIKSLDKKLGDKNPLKR